MHRSYSHHVPMKLSYTTCDDDDDEDDPPVTAAAAIVGAGLGTSLT